MIELFSGEFAVTLFRTVLLVLFFGAASVISDRVLAVMFRKVSEKSPLLSYQNRIHTLSSIARNVTRVSMVVFFFLTLASELGFTIAPIITGAGVAGLAISFGAQTLVKDVISGFFLILDNQVNVGDRVQIGDAQGRVTQLLLRKIVLRADDGDTIYIPNSEVKKIVVYAKKTKQTD